MSEQWPMSNLRHQLHMYGNVMSLCPHTAHSRNLRRRKHLNWTCCFLLCFSGELMVSVPCHMTLMV